MRRLGRLLRPQRDAIGKGRKFTAAEVAEMRAAELEGEV